MTKKARRLYLVGAALVVLALAVSLIAYALRDNIVFFYGPSEALQKHSRPDQRMRIGGLVKEGSLIKDQQVISFIITDQKADIKVDYRGQVPDLFREGQGVVAEGIFGSGDIFKADNILAKHDERYMPREVADALKKQGVWNEGQSTVKR
jgi:cytochrome c-type biogenesis protein CcmE